MADSSLPRQLVRWTPRYLLVSLICFACSNALLIGFDALGAPYWATLILNALVLIPLGFFLQALITFSVPLTWRAFCRYGLVFLPNTPVAFLLLWLLRDRLNLAMTIAAPAVTIGMVLWNYVGSIWALHRRAPAAMAAD